MAYIQDCCGGGSCNGNPPGMIVAAAEYAQGKDIAPPPELSDYFKGKMLSSLPNGNGWKHEPYRWIERVTAYVSVYNAASQFSEASRNLKGKDLAKWMQANKAIVETVTKVEKMKNGS